MFIEFFNTDYFLIKVKILNPCSKYAALDGKGDNNGIQNKLISIAKLTLIFAYKQFIYNVCKYSYGQNLANPTSLFYFELNCRAEKRSILPSHEVISDNPNWKANWKLMFFLLFGRRLVIIFLNIITE